VWLYNTAFSFGLPLLVLRAAIRLNNVEVAKGALYCAKSLAWASYLPLYRQAILRSGLVEESQAPPDLQDFISKHKFGQRNKLNGEPQEVDFTHQPLDMLNEEVIRSLLDYLDKKRLQKNADSNKPHQDFEVFQDAARWLAFYGDKWLNNEEFDRSKRRYRASYKSTMVLRKLLRTRGYLVDFENPNQPFYSIDLQMEPHPEYHNMKLSGEQIFSDCLDQLKSGVDFGDLTNQYVPKTLEDEYNVAKRTELSKEKLFENVKKTVIEALKNFPSDSVLSDIYKELSKKTFQSYNPKSKLKDLQGKVDQHLDDLNNDKEFSDLMDMFEGSDIYEDE